MARPKSIPETGRKVDSTGLKVDSEMFLKGFPLGVGILDRFLCMKTIRYQRILAKVSHQSCTSSKLYQVNILLHPMEMDSEEFLFVFDLISKECLLKSLQNRGMG